MSKRPHTLSVHPSVPATMDIVQTGGDSAVPKTISLSGELSRSRFASASARVALAANTAVNFLRMESVTATARFARRNHLL